MKAQRAAMALRSAPLPPLLLPLLLLLFLLPLLALGSTTFQLGTSEVTHEWTTVLTDTVADPIVVAEPATYRETDQAHAQVRNVTVGSFEIRLIEASNEDGVHIAETVGWMVATRGSSTVSGRQVESGTVFGAGRATTNADWYNPTFGTPFSSPPACWSALQTLDGLDEVAHTRQREASTTSCNFAMEREERFRDLDEHGDETIGWICLEVGVTGGIENGVALETEVLLSPDTVTHLTYTATFSGIPTDGDGAEMGLATMQSYDGGDPAWIRLVNIYDNKMEVFIQEDQTRDSELSHTTETVGLLMRACGARELQLGTPTGPVNNEAVVAQCERLFYRAADGWGNLPWVVLRVETAGASVPAGYASATATAPTEAVFDAADASGASASFDLAVVNPEPEGITLMLSSAAQYEANVTLVEPTYGDIEVMNATNVTSEHHWVLVRYRPAADYQYVDVTARSGDGSALEIKIMRNALPTRTEFDFEDLTADGVTGLYTVRMLAPDTTTDYVVGVYTAATANNTVELLLEPAAPNILGLSPSFGNTAGGYTLTISGQNLGGGVEVDVSFDGGPCDSVSFVSGSVHCTVPEGDGVNRLVQVTHYGVPSNTQQFSFNAPQIDSATVPGDADDLLRTVGGDEILVSGSNFGLSGNLTVNGLPCVPTAYSHTELRCQSAEGQGLAEEVQLEVSGQQSNVVIMAFKRPELVSRAPNSLPTLGGALTVTGTDFGVGGDSSVAIGGVDCPITFHNHTTVVCDAPAGQGTGHTLVLTVASQTSVNPLSLDVSYEAPAVTSLLPASGPTTGVPVVLLGSNFGSSGTVSFGSSGDTCAQTLYNSTRIECVVPEGQGVGQEVRVTVSGQTSNTELFDFDAPAIADVRPSPATTEGGVPVTLTGTSFGLTGTVSVGGLSCAVVSHNHTSVVCTLPEGQGVDKDVLLSVAGQASTGGDDAFSYLAPSVAVLSQYNSTTAGGAVLTLAGTNFGTTGSVTVGGAVCTVTGAGYSHTSIECLVPAGQGVGQEVVVTAASQSSAPQYLSYLPPSIASVSPASLGTGGGEALTVEGSNFGTGGAVYVDGADCPVVAWGHSTVRCEAPAGRGQNLNVTLAAGGQADTVLSFNYSAPAITGVAGGVSGFPTAGGTLLTVSGTSFDTDGAVTVNGNACATASWSHTEVVCFLPEGQGEDSAVVLTTVGARASEAALFDYDAPVVSSAAAVPDAPTRGGTNLTLSGSNLGVSGAAVLVNGAACPVLSQAHAEIVCALPEGVGTDRLIQVTVGGQSQTGSTLLFSYDAPVVDAVSPASAFTQGGVTLTVTGSNYGADGSGTVSVSVGAADCPVTARNHTAVLCTLPAGSGEEVVRVTVSGQQSNTAAFSYVPPSITALEPANGTTEGGTTLTLTGTSFGLDGSVLVGGRSCAVTFHNHTRVECTLPSGSGAGKELTITVDGQTSAPAAFSYLAPVLLDVSPSVGETAGGTVLNVTGLHFGTTGFATVGGQQCALVPGEYSQRGFLCTVPAGAGAGLEVQLTVSEQASNAADFSYIAPAVDSATPAGLGTEGGATLTLVGSNFGESGTVLVGGKACSVSSAANYKHGSVRCALPEGKGTVNVTVTTGGQTSPAVSYTYGAPSISSASPLSGPTAGGGTLTVQGSNFGDAGILTVGGSVCNASLLADGVYDHERIECPVPHGSGASNLLYLVVGGQDTTYGLGAYAYDPPSVTGVTPALAPTDGGSTVTVEGSDFGVVGTMRVTFGGNNCTSVAARGHSSFECQLPEGVGAPVAVQVTVDGQTSAPAASVFGYEAPVIDSVSSSGCTDVGSTTTECPTAGGVTLTVAGSNFGAAGALSVAVEDTTCTSVTPGADPHAGFECVLQAGLGFDKALTVTVGGQTSNAVLISYQVPVIDDNTIRLLGDAAGASSFAVADTDGGQDIEFDGQYFGASPSVRYGLPGTAYASMPFECAVDLGASTASHIECALEAGAGTGLVFVVSDGLQLSPESADTLDYPTPVIVSGTIRTDSGAAGGTAVPGLRSEGEQIYFDARHVGDDASLVTVQYGAPGGPHDQACTSVTLDTSGADTVVGCKTSPGEGEGYVFVVTALNADSPEGTDTYSYPLSPIVTRVVGCPADDALTNATGSCPTAGGERLTITGQHYSAAVSVKVGSNDCTDVAVTPGGTEVQCTLPAGAGLDLSVLVVSGELFSRQNALLSYAVPSLSSVSGCALDGGSNTAECDRYGNDTVTLTGTNFGASDATVLVGGELCELVEHDASTPHEVVTCRLPAGTQLSRSVLLIQSRGEISSDRVFVSYTQCAAGFFDNSTDTASDLACTPCAAGSVTAAAGQDSCASCEAGFYAPHTNMTACLKCLKGTYSERVGGAGAVQCEPCEAGRFTNADGQDACLECPAGTYGPDAQRTSCLSCERGTENSGTGRTACTNCTAGRFAAETRTLECDECPPGAFSGADAASSCESCARGTFAADPGATACEDCAAGTAIDSTGQSQCNPCDSGFFSNATGLDSCYACPAGSVSLKAGGAPAGPTGCTPCAEGEYIGASGQVVCLLCPKGNYQPAAGQSRCDACPLGTFAANLGSDACTNCTAGSAAPTAGTVACGPCAAGTFSAAGGATACEQCAAGRFQASSGRPSCDPCAAGDAQASLGQPACSPCDVGFYAAGGAAAACERCPAGFVAAGAGSTGCVACEPGDFSESEAQGVCKTCPVGTFSAASNSTACAQCDAGSVAGTEGSTACANCTSGFYSPAAGGQTCERCPAGQYQPLDGQSACLACEAGRAQADTSQGDCDDCPPGQFSSSTGQAVCLVCPAGSFSNATRSSSCHSCPPGRFQDEADRTECKPCAAGSFTASSGQPACVQCPVGTFGAAEGQSSCEDCARGRFASAAGATRCANCTAGQFADEEGTIVCKDCAVGRYNGASGLSACAACAAGRFQDQPAATACDACAAGSAQPSEGQASCADCAVGTATPLGEQASCAACGAGFFAASAGATSCEPCAAGSFSAAAGLGACEDCPVGRHAAAANSSACDACPAGEFQDESGQASCEPCAAGSANGFTGQAACSPCRAGSFANETRATACARCEAGSFSAASADSCTLCAAGRFGSVAGLDSCVDCPVGTSGGAEGLTACQSCTPGRHAPAARSLECAGCVAGRAAGGFAAQTCEICGLGTFSAADNSTACEDCAAGTFQDDEGQTACQPCAAGTFARSTGQAVCVDCSVGFYSNASGAEECAACPAGSAQASTGRTSCRACDPGTAVGASGQALCAECDSGTFANGTGLTACQDCPAGTSSEPAADGSGPAVCEPCAPGYYSGAVGQPLCLPCPFGTKAAAAGASACDDCEAGRYADFGAATACAACDEGSFSSDGFVECEPCGTGTFANDTGATGCESCPRGRYETRTGSSECLVCEAGSFSPAAGSLLCDPCEPGTASNGTGTFACDACGSGTYQGDFGETSCLPCAAGTFTAAERQRECELCEPGFYAPGTGATSCLPCARGEFQDEFGRQECVPCALGTFTAALGQKVCELCPPGTFGNATGTEECLECPPGTYQDEFGQQGCVPCALGSYNPSSRQRACTPCDVGTFAAAEGLTACAQCGAGEFQDRTGTSSCGDCPIGEYMPSTGESACLDCPPGTFGNDTAATGCVECPAGTANPNEGRLACDLCAPGFFAGTNQRECTVCQDGTVAPDNGTTACVPCSDSSSPNFFKTECDCDAGFFLPDQLGDETTGCLDCPVGADCDEAGVRFSTIEAAPGWWRSSLEDESFMRCLVRKHCVGGRGGFDAATGEYLGSACRENRGGPLCGICLKGYYETAGGECVACPEEAGSWTFFFFVAVLVVFLLWLQLYIVLRSGDDLITKSLEAEADAQMLAELKMDDEGEYSGSGSESSYSSYSGSESSYSYSGSESYSESESAASSVPPPTAAVHADNLVTAAILQDEYAPEQRNENVLTIHGPPLPPPNFTYALKIMLSFLQIVASLGSGLEIQWPERYQEAVSTMNVVDTSFIIESSLGCVDTVRYYQTFVIIVSIVPACFVLIGVFYFLPRRYGLCGRTATHADQLRSTISAWRLFLYILFLIYPGVSSTVLRHYICKDVYGTSYLLTDLRVECNTDLWNYFAYGAITLVLLYPIGIPTFFYALLRINRDHLGDDRVKAQLGFLYAGYRDATWFWEIADSAHKLFLTSLLAFFPQPSQLPLGMAIAIVYLSSLLVVNPYIRSEDDRLHLLAQTEIFLLLLAGYVVYHQPSAELTDKEDLALSVVLLAMTFLFFAAFLYLGGRFLRRVFMRWWNGRKEARRKAAEDERKMEEMEMAAAAKGATAGSPKKAAPLEVQLPGSVKQPVDGSSEESSTGGSSSYSGSGSGSYSSSRSRSAASYTGAAAAPAPAPRPMLAPVPPPGPRPTGLGALPPLSPSASSQGSRVGALPPLRPSSNPSSPPSGGGW